MVVLQAAMAAGFIMVLLLGIMLVIGVPVLTIILMRMYRNASGKNDGARKPLYKEIVPIIVIVIISIVAVLLLFFF